MVKRLIAVLISGCFFVCTKGIVAQTQSDTIWVSSNETVCDKATASYFRKLNWVDSTNTFQVRDYYLTGELHMSGSFRTLNPIIREGDFYWYHKNGTKKMHAIFISNTRNNVRVWGSDGKEKYLALHPVKSEAGKLIQQESTFDQLASFPGGMMAMDKFIEQELTYPESAKSNQINGRVLVKLLVDETGRITRPIVVLPLDPACDAEALRVVQSMPDWVPGIFEGHAEPMYVTVSFYFSPQKPTSILNETRLF